MTRWEILEKAKEVLEGEYGDGKLRELRLGENYKPVQKVVDAIIEGEDHISKEIEKHKEKIRKLELSLYINNKGNSREKEEQ